MADNDNRPDLAAAIVALNEGLAEIQERAEPVVRDLLDRFSDWMDKPETKTLFQNFAIHMSRMAETEEDREIWRKRLDELERN